MSARKTEDLTYTLPPDIIHYEVKYFLGFSINELLVAATAGIMVMMLVSAIVGLMVGAVMLVLLRRYEAFGNRTIPAYLLALLWRRVRVVRVEAPRTFPSIQGRLEILSWDDEPLYSLESE